MYAGPLRRLSCEPKPDREPPAAWINGVVSVAVAQRGPRPGHAGSDDETARRGGTAPRFEVRMRRPERLREGARAVVHTLLTSTGGYSAAVSRDGAALR